MPDLNTLLLFIVASVALAVTPGPDNIFVLTQSATYGKRTGILVTIGLCCGLIIHTLAVVLGVASIIATSAMAFAVLKTCGAAYLLYLAYQAFKAEPIDPSQTTQSIGASAKKLISRGFIMNVTNPKVAIFFLAFLPQFVDAELPNSTFVVCLLGFLFMLNALIIFSAIAIFAGRIGKLLRRSTGIQVVINRTAASIFVLLALRLMMTRL